MPDQARIYLDHAATTPVIPAARDAMADAMTRFDYGKALAIVRDVLSSVNASQA